MKKKSFDKIFLSTSNLKHQLRVAFGLIIIATLVFVGYLFPGISSWFHERSMLHIVVLIAVGNIFIGFVIIKGIVDPIVQLTNEARMIADGNFERHIEMRREDEIGALGTALNHMTRHIKDNLEELSNYSKRTEAINAEISRRVLTLSSLVEISNLIAQNADLQVILRASVEKCLEFGDMTLGCLVLKNPDTGEFQVQMLSGLSSDDLMDVGITGMKINLGRGLIGKTILRQSILVLDQSSEGSDEIIEFKNKFSVTNAVLAPITSKGNVFGVLIAGNNNQNFVCSETDREVFELIAKQIAIAVTNNLLMREIEKLEVTDRLTGLFNNTFTRKRLNEEIKNAATRHQPCSFAIFAIDKFDDYLRVFGHIMGESVLIRAGNIFKESITPADKAARFGDHEFALILPGRNKKDSIKIAEKICTRFKEFFAKEEDERKQLTCSGAITENPIDGMTADELILKSGVMLTEAKSQGGNQILF